MKEPEASEPKSPVVVLDETCRKRGLTPVYTLVSREGPSHRPEFTYQLTVGDKAVEGRGPNKRTAKREAATVMLDEAEFPDIEVQPVGRRDAAIEVCVESTNPIGSIQEFCQKNLWPLPVYTFQGVSTPVTRRQFICDVHLLNLNAQGTGSSKKIAKRSAAEALQKMLADGSVISKAKVAAEVEQDGLLGNGQNTICSDIAVTLNHMIHEENHYCPSMSNYCPMLQEIAEQHKFEVTYVDIPEQTVTGQHQCLVQLSTMPVVVCHGYGRTKDEAHAVAAHNSLQYLTIQQTG